ncbi:MAG TPA: hypothetical protein VGN16_21145 [Acidobacteriaceae bacterium]|jgi:hypothetical protein
MKKVAILFARRDSVYKTLENCDVWDEERDARNWVGGSPVVAHPPCAQWGNLYKFATPNPAIKALAVLAVRRNGGVLEHPRGSKLWKHCRLPRPGQIDRWGGFTLPILQQWFGHRAEKATWLYICGVSPHLLPEMPFVLGKASHVITRSRGCRKWPETTKAERERTPSMLAEWLVEVARRTAATQF